MRFRTSQKVWSAGLLAVVGVQLASCGKVKDALEDAAGFKKLESSDIEQLKKDVSWSDEKLKTKFEIVAGFKLTDKFKGDLAKAYELPFDASFIPEKARGNLASNDKASMMLLAKKVEVEFGDKKLTRFQIVNAARYNPDASKLEIKGDVVNKYLDEKQQVSIANKNQEGDYVLIKAAGAGSLLFLTGEAVVKTSGEADSAAKPVKDAVVFTTESTFVTVSGSETGKYILAIPNDTNGGKNCPQAGMLVGNSKSVAALNGPKTTQSEVPCTGALDKYKEQLDAKAKEGEAAGVSGASAKSTEAFTKVNKVVTDFVGGWEAAATKLMWILPPPAPAPTAVTAPPAATTPTASAPKTDGATNTPTTPPTPNPSTAPVEPVTAPTGDIVRGDTTENVNLGCTFAGIDPTTGFARSLNFDPTKFATHTAWNAVGDVRITTDLAPAIFGGVLNSNERKPGDANPDDAYGYCLLSTGDGQYVAGGSKSDVLKPVEGKVSEMWQKVKIPDGAKCIQMSVAFFSQEFPEFVGSSFNDFFYAVFDESPYPVAYGSLNDLAKTDSYAGVGATCDKTNATYKTSRPCGEWDFIHAASAGSLHGVLWNIDKSTQAPKKCNRFLCGAASPYNSSDDKGFHGMIASRVIKRPLDATYEAPGATLTLRIGVSDAGDAYYDSAVAVDSIVFGKTDAACNSTFTGRTESAASRYDAF